MTMAKPLDLDVLNPAVTGVMEEVLAKLGGINPTASPTTKTVDIEEYEGRMRVNGIDKFQAPSYISTVVFYSSAGDAGQHRNAKGTVVLYVDHENAGKLFNGLGFRVPEDEDDVSMMESCGKMADLIASTFKNRLVQQGYADLAKSAPSNYKNSVPEGVEFSKDQTSKQEYCFFYWKRKAIIVEVALTPIPRR